MLEENVLSSYLVIHILVVTGSTAWNIKWSNMKKMYFIKYVQETLKGGYSSTQSEE